MSPNFSQLCREMSATAVKFTKCSPAGKIGCSFLSMKDDHYNEVARWLVEAVAHLSNRR